MGTAVAALQRTGPLTEVEAEQAIIVADAVSLGASLHDIEERGGPTVATVLAWLRRDKEFAQYYNDNRKVSAYWFEDQAYAISRQMWRDKIRDPNLLRNGEQYQKRLEWMAKVRNPAVFGDKVQAQIMTPVTFITNLDIGGDAKPSDLGNTYTVKAMVPRMIDVTEVPDDAIVVLDDAGEAIVIAPEGESASSPETSPDQKKGQLGDQGAPRERKSGRATRKGAGSSSPSPSPRDSTRSGRTPRVPVRKAGPVESEET